MVDHDGMLYVAVEEERRLAHAFGLGQFIKLDPTRPDQPIVWQRAIPDIAGISGPAGGPGDGGVWATPAIYDDWLYVPTHAGDLLGVDRFSGAVVWRERIGYHEWSSPAVVANPDGTVHLVVGTCNTPGVRLCVDRPQATNRTVAGESAWLHRIHPDRLGRTDLCRFA